MTRPDDDDPATIDWGPDADTTPDGDAITATAVPVVPEADTAKFRSLDYQMGRESGFTEGVSLALRALGAELLKAGLTPAEASLTLARVQTAALERG